MTIKTTLNKKETKILSFLVGALREDTNNLKELLREIEPNVEKEIESLYFKMIGLNTKANKKI